MRRHAGKKEAGAPRFCADIIAGYKTRAKSPTNDNDRNGIVFSYPW